MTYALKTIKHQASDRHILLQNENGPCPLLAAANALLLKGTIELPAHCIRNSVASLEDVTNMLANRAMHNHASEAHFVDELMHHIPRFQYGMDVNPKFTDGISGYEYTSELTAFDMLQVKLVHGWLVDPQQEETCAALGNKTYNEAVEWIIKGNEAGGEIDKVQKELYALRAAVQTVDVDLLNEGPGDIGRASKLESQIAEKQTKLDELSKASLHGSLINNFLQMTGHQLTQYGLQTLHETLNEDQLCVFFRNNHYGTITKHEGLLYLLVTDLGYSNSPAIVWEKLDVIDGDTEYVNSQFKTPKKSAMVAKSGTTLSPQQLAAQSGQKESDLQLAMRLSLQESGGVQSSGPSLDQQEGELVKAATEASLREYNGIKSEAPAITVNLPESLAGQRVEVGVPLSKPTTLVPDKPESAPIFIAQEDSDRKLAMKLQSGGPSEDGCSLQLARQLQEEEDQKAALVRFEQRQRAAVAKKAKADEKCVIS